MFENSRSKLIEMLENNMLGWETVCRECLERMSTDEVQDMMRECEWDLPDFDED